MSFRGKVRGGPHAPALITAFESRQAQSLAAAPYARRHHAGSRMGDARGQPAWSPGLQLQVREDLLERRRLQDGGDGLEWAAAVQAAVKVDREHTPEPPSKAETQYRCPSSATA